MEQIELVGEEFWVGEFTLGKDIDHLWYVHWDDWDAGDRVCHTVYPEQLNCNAPLYLDGETLTGTGKVIQMGDTVYITDISTNDYRQFDGSDVPTVSDGVAGTLSVSDRTQGEITSSVLRNPDAPVTRTETQTPDGSGHPGIPCSE